MTRSIPTIRDALLLFGEEEQTSSLVVGSVAWFKWLDQETSILFSFHTLDGFYTARKERAGNRRGGWYWKAYRKVQGIQYRVYLGKAEDLTLERLEQTARTLTARIQEQTAQKELARALPVTSSQPDPQGHDQETMTPLLETRFHPPRLPVLLVERPQLLALLDTGYRQKLTQLHTPAGFGKTTLVAQWVAHQQAQAEAEQISPLSVAWISLESGDNDPIRFWSSLITACQSFHADIGQTALAHLTQTARLPFSASSLETALTLLLNDLAHSSSRSVLILEEYHLIEHARIHETLTFFIDHLPAACHVMILTRVEPPFPLARWRARGDLLEISHGQLRFSEEETATFLHQIIPRSFSIEAVRALSAHLEGWAAGLRLLTLSLQHHMAPQAIEDALKQLHTGSAVDRTHRSIQDYFLSEVLKAQPEPLQLFLLQTSIFSRLTSSLCDAVTGRQDSAAWLEVIERSSFFLEALDNTGEWYRYHALFAETMRNEARHRLGEEALRTLFMEASRWYEVHAMLVEAIEASFSAREFARAAYLIEKLNAASYFHEYHTMRRWLKQLPEALLRIHPALCFRYAQVQLFPEASGVSITHVENLLQMAEEGWHNEDNLPGVGMLHAFRATYLLLEGHFAPAVTHARLALQLLPLEGELPDEHIHGRHDWRCICLLAIGMDMMREGSFTKARQSLLAANTLSLNNQDRVFTPIIGRVLGDVCLELGELRQAHSYYQHILANLQLYSGNGEEFLRVQTLCVLARLSYEWNELEKAEQIVRELSLYRYPGAFPSGEEATRLQVELLNLRLLHARGKADEMRTALSTLLVHLQATPHGLPGLPDVLIQQARLQIGDGELAAAEYTLEILAQAETGLSPLHRQEMHLLHARLHLAQGEAERSLSELLPLLVFAQQGQHLIRVLEIQLLLALAYAALQRQQESHQQLTLVLSQARNEKLVRLFLDEGEPLSALLRALYPSLTEQQKPLRIFVRHLLHAFAPAPSPDATNSNGTEGFLLEPLSAQEQRVLTLLVSGHSNPEIAEELIISINTVKGHVKNLYRKLDVTNRIEASETARRLKLL